MSKQKRHAKERAPTLMAPPDGDWLWFQLMQFCQRRGVHPGDYNDLFAIVGRARDERLRQVSEQESLARRLRRASGVVFDNGDDDSPALCLVRCKDARAASRILSGEPPTAT